MIQKDSPRLPVAGASDLEAAKAFADLHVEFVDADGFGFGQAAAGDFDEHVGALAFFWQGEDVILAGREHDFLALVGTDHAEAAGVLGDERIRAEKEFEVHRVVVHRDFDQVAVVQRDGLVFDLHVYGRYLRLAATGFVGSLGLQDSGEPYHRPFALPAVRLSDSPPSSQPTH